MCGSPRTGVLTASSSSACRSLGLDVRPQPRAQVDRAGSRSGTTAAVEHDVVRDHDRVLALRERRVEQAERRDDALDLAREPAGLQPHAVADPERPRGDQHHARRSGCRASAVPRDRTTTAVIAPPTASVAARARRPAARASAATTRNTQPDQEARPCPPSPGPCRRNSAGASERGRDRAPAPSRARPSRSRRAIAHGRVDAEQLLAAEVGDSVTASSGTSTSSSRWRGGRCCARLQGQAARLAGRGVKCGFGMRGIASGQHARALRGSGHVHIMSLLTQASRRRAGPPHAACAAPLRRVQPVVQNSDGLLDAGASLLGRARRPVPCRRAVASRPAMTNALRVGDRFAHGAPAARRASAARRAGSIGAARVQPLVARTSSGPVLAQPVEEDLRGPAAQGSVDARRCAPRRPRWPARRSAPPAQASR